MREERGVLLDGEGALDAVAVADEVALFADVVVLCAAFQQDGARCQRQEAGDGADQRCLTGAVGAGQNEGFAGGKGE